MCLFRLKDYETTDSSAFYKHQWLSKKTGEKGCWSKGLSQTLIFVLQYFDKKVKCNNFRSMKWD